MSIIAIGNSGISTPQAVRLGIPGARADVAVPWYLANTPLANSLVGLWKLSEISGNRADSIGVSTLTDNATVTSASGIVYPLAAEFVIANSESLSAADSAALSGGNIDMWGFAWFRPTAVNVTSTIFAKWNITGNHREWQVVQVNADVSLQTSPDGTSTGNGFLTVAGVLTANTWTLAVWYHDSVNNLIGLSINGSAFSTAAYTTGIFNSAASFRIGAQGAGSAFFGGRIGPVALGKNYVPTIQDASFLYNYGVDSGVHSVTFFGLGGEIAWSADGTQLVFDRRDGSGIYQLYTINPDGSGEVCISDPAVVGGPTVGKHKGWPAFHPNGTHLVCQAEMATHPPSGDPDITEPGRGAWNNIWVAKVDGSQWWQLTDYDPNGATGTLSPRFNHDGTKLFWARKIGQVTVPAPFAQWDLSIADFAFVDGVPTISNVTTFAPGAKLFYESHGFNRDNTKIIFTSDPVTNPYAPDIYISNLDGSGLVNLTNSDTQWDEHATYAPHADVLAYMSSSPYATYIADAANWNATLKSEAFVMNSDGTNKRQLTHFNVAGFAEYNAERSVATTVAWHPDGTRAVVTQLLLGASYDTSPGRMMWIVRFNGVYA